MARDFSSSTTCTHVIHKTAGIRSFRTTRASKSSNLRLSEARIYLPLSAITRDSHRANEECFSFPMENEYRGTRITGENQWFEFADSGIRGETCERVNERFRVLGQE